MLKNFKQTNLHNYGYGTKSVVLDELIRDNFLNIILKKKNTTCLEIGCQDYRQTKIIHKFYKKIYSIDKFDYKGKLSIKKLTFKKIDAESYDIPNEVKDIFF
jgi:hypothetical protein